MSDEKSVSDAGEWEVLGGGEAGMSTAAKLVESFWRKASGANDVIERSEEALSSTILEERDEERQVGQGAGDETYRLFEPLRTRVESALTAVLYGFGSENPSSRAESLEKLMANR